MAVRQPKCRGYHDEADKPQPLFEDGLSNLGVEFFNGLIDGFLYYFVNVFFGHFYGSGVHLIPLSGDKPSEDNQQRSLHFGGAQVVDRFQVFKLELYAAEVFHLLVELSNFIIVNYERLAIF